MNESLKSCSGVFLHPDFHKFIEYMKSRYGFNSTAFQGDKEGHYDPLAAMKRDSQHGVIKDLISDCNQIQNYGQTPKTTVSRA